MAVELQAAAQQGPGAEQREEHARTLRDSVIELAEARMKLDTSESELSSLLAARQLAFAKENEALIEEVASTGERVKVLEEETRARAIDSFRMDGNKQPHDGVTVTASCSFNYPPGDALSWAKAHELCLIPASLDRKAFEAICKSDSTRPGFVTLEEKLGVRIATDLAKALGIEKPSADGQVTIPIVEVRRTAEGLECVEREADEVFG